MTRFATVRHLSSELSFMYILMTCSTSQLLIPMELLCAFGRYFPVLMTFDARDGCMCAEKRKAGCTVIRQRIGGTGESILRVACVAVSVILPSIELFRMRIRVTIPALLELHNMESRTSAGIQCLCILRVTLFAFH